MPERLLLIAAFVSLLIWVYLLIGRGGFWRVSHHLVPCPSAVPSKRIVAVIPARNEAAGIASTVLSLLNQTLPETPALEIIVVDDASTDGTAQLALDAAAQAGQPHRLTVLKGRQPLPPGWTGKLWALSQGVAQAESLNPDYLLFSDADIQHSPSNVRELLARAETGYDLVSHMVKLTCDTVAEKALIPAFVFFFLMLYPPSWISSERKRAAGAAGGCMLIRKPMLVQIGGVASIGAQIIDDCALARRIKECGGRVWLELTATTTSTRAYESFGEIARMISRTAFSQLRHSTWLLVWANVGLFFTYLLPPLLLFSSGRIAWIGATAWLLMSLAYLPMVRFYRLSPIWSVALPPIALFYIGATIRSAVQYWRGRGGEWKGRSQDRS